LPWGADPAYFVSPPDRVDHLRAKLGLELENRVLLGLGRLVGKKGFANLVAAYASLRPQFADARLVIVGDGPEMGSLQDQTVALGVAEGVVFAGQADWTDVPAYLALADVFVAPSVYDNGNVDALPTVILEAMAAGKPVVASRIVGIPLVVKEGVNGFLVKENDVPALAEALKQVLDSEELRTRLGRMGRRMIEEWLNWRNVARSFIDLYCGRKPLLEDHLKVG
jgi:glycosyltransferase involved in cell wall biosynthesis